MGHINRIRVNNIKYNDGTQFYDDLCLKFQGKNSLYDLANGGGKSVLMLLLLQNMIPNCTLDEKQPIEKLFRGNDTSTVIHSLVEWELDQPDQERSGFRFMTTGFCARKGKDEVNSSSIEYFNYCIFYSEYQEYDIKNFPLASGRERISYTGLRSLLRQLAESNHRKLMVILPEGKNKYQNFIAGYGIYESQWNMIRGINKTEGHVRTYFENNYRTARKIVENLLIEEIIQKAYRLKTGQEREEEQLAQTLLDIQEKLLDLSKKKQQILNYDRQTDIIKQFISRNKPMIEGFQMQESVKQKTGAFYYALIKEEETAAQELEQTGRELKRTEEARFENDRKLDTLEIQELEYQVTLEVEELKQVMGLNQNVKQSLAFMKELREQKEAGNYYLKYRADQKKYLQVREEIEGLKKGNEEQLHLLEVLVGQKKSMDDQSRDRLSEQKEETEQMLLRLKKEAQFALESERRADNSLAVLKSKYEVQTLRIGKVQEKIKALQRNLPVFLREQLVEKQAQEKQQEESLRKHLEEQEVRIEQWKDEFNGGILEEKDLNYQLEVIAKAKNELTRHLQEYETLSCKVEKRGIIYGETQPKRLKEAIEQKRRDSIIELSNGKTQKIHLTDYLAQLESGIPFMISEEAETLLLYLQKKFRDGVSGVELLAEYGQEEKASLLERIPFLPYSIIVSHQVYEQIKMHPKSEEWLNLRWIVPVIDQNYLDSKYYLQQEGVMFAGKEVSYFLEQDKMEQEKEKTRMQLNELNQKLLKLKDLETTYETDYELLRHYVEEVWFYYDSWVTELEGREEDEEKQRQKKQQCLRKQEQLNDQIKRTQLELPGIKTQIQEAVDMRICLDQLLAGYEELDEGKEEQDRLSKQEVQMRKERLEWEQKTVQLQQQVEEKKTVLQVVKDRLVQMQETWQRYEPYYRHELEITEWNGSEGDLEAKLNGVLDAFENENRNVTEKNQLMTVLKNSMDLALGEIKKREQDLEKLKLLDEDNQLRETSDEKLLEMKYQIRAAQKECDDYSKREYKLQAVMGEHSKRITDLTEKLIKKYQHLERLKENAVEFTNVREQLERQKSELGRQIQQLFDRREQEKLKQIRIGAMKTSVITLMELHQMELSEQNQEYLEFPVTDLKEADHEVRQLWKQADAKQKKAVSIFEKAKYDCEEALKAIDASGFALQMKEQIKIPQQLNQAEQQIQNLEQACVLIQMEKSQIESGLKEIQQIKQSFENQCLQRCNNVRMELDKFPKLSSIIIDDKLTQIVKLRIPYVKDEQQEYGISSYIESMIESLQQYQTVQEKKAYLMQELSLKKMFSAIVTDMNRIGLELYKRERIKEQSRHLRYEEAVGSTGQSQGIYIQFLISVINYIANISSYHVNHDLLKKVIFIDNPFGAAKDTYIWEPIFTMLAANHVQLIVPTRGATPAIIGKFSVNYLLGQKLVGKRQQTVIVDYRSQIDGETAEYTGLEYYQGNLFEEV